LALIDEDFKSVEWDESKINIYYKNRQSEYHEDGY